MKSHYISSSVVSLANPWLDFLSSESAASVARDVNDDMSQLCSSHPGKIFALGTLPVSAPVGEVVQEVKRLKTLEGIRGIILGTTGLGKGLDDSTMDPIWSSIALTGLLVFIHPHYGLPTEVFGPKLADSGHVMPLSLGFPLETTIAFTRMFLAGVFDRHPGLKVLLAHAGGAIPFLAGRIESCVQHERVLRDEAGKLPEGRSSIWDVLKRNVWLDGVVYSAVGIKAAVDVVGKEKVLWGTDHPFFPPIGEEADEEVWKSVTLNADAVLEAFGGDKEGAEGVLGGNAIRLLGLDVK